MNRRIALLAILPAGLALGLATAWMVDPTHTRNGVTGAQDEPAAVGYGPSPEGEAAAPEQSFAPAGPGRPDFDWSAEAWPQDRAEAGGPYALDGSYFGQDDQPGGYGSWDGGGDHAPDRDDSATNGMSRTPPTSSRGGEAAAAGRAAAQAADDAVRAAGGGADRIARPGAAATPGDRTREPRTADGELPAIW